MFALKREPAHLKERAKNGEILLLTFEQVMALYDSAPEKWELEVDGPIYYPQGKEQEGLLVFLLPRERKRYRAWFDWRLSHGEEERRSPDDGPGPAVPCRRIWPGTCGSCRRPTRRPWRNPHRAIEPGPEGKPAGGDGNLLRRFDKM